MRPNLWFLVPAAVALSAAVAAWQRARLPARGDWQAAADYVRAHLEPGDGVVWTPYTQGEGRLFFAGLPVLHTRDLAAADLARYDRVWVLGALGHGAAALPPMHRRLLVEPPAGAVTVELVAVGGPRVVGDLFAHLEDAVYSRRRRDGSEQRCDFWSGTGWHCELRDSPEATRACLGRPIGARLADKAKDPDCGLNPWLHASRDVRLIGDTPRHCLWLHPVADATARLAWPAAPAGDTLSVDFGFSDPMVADNYKKQLRVAPARLRVLRGAAEVAVVEVPAEKGWHHWEAPLPGDTAAPLAFEIEAPAITDAHFCFDPTVRRARQEQSAP